MARYRAIVTIPPPDPVPVMKLHGTFRSGSNYVKALLELNYEVEVHNGDGGFKHAPYPAMFEGRDWIPPQTPVLVTVKDPHAWLTSMWRFVQGKGSQHVRCGSSWETFLVDPLIVFHGGFAGFPRYRFANPVDYWNAMYYNLLSLDPEIRYVARYEDALAGPEVVCDRIAQQFDLSRVTPEFIRITKRVQNMADRPRSTIEDYAHESTFDPNDYTDKRYLDEFTEAQHGWVVRSVDADVASELHYLV